MLVTSEPPAIPGDTLALLPGSPVAADSVRLPARAPEAGRPHVQLGASYTGWKVTGVSIHGLPGDVATEMRHGLVLSGSTKWLVMHRYPVFDPRLLASDLDRSRLFLVRSGYPEAAVTPAFATNVGKRVVSVTFDVVPGPRLLVASNRTEAIPPSLEPRARRLLRLQRDEPFTDTQVERRISRLLNLLQEDGRAKATVTTRLTRLDSTHVDVLFVVNAGAVYHVSDVVVDGLAPNLRPTVDRTIDLNRGDQYSPGRLHRAEDGLRGLDLFRQIEVTTVDAGAESLDVVANLAERTPRTFELGVGYFTDDQAQVQGEWKHRNLFGGGRGGSVNARYSKFLQQAGVTLWKPVLFHSRTRGSLTLDARRESEELYALRTEEIEAAALYQRSVKTTWRPAITVSHIQVDTALPIDSVFDSPPTSLLTLGARWTHSALNDPIDPRRGTYVWASAEYGLPNFRTTNQYALSEVELNAYGPITRRTLVVTRLHAGAALFVGNSIGLLPNKRFYGGGANSMRGYRRRKLGPLDAESRPIGGVALFESSFEYRFPLFGELSGATFVDTGQVWESRNDFLKNLAVATGPGLLLRTPVGLARLDVGFLVTPPEPNEPRTVFQLQVGHAF